MHVLHARQLLASCYAASRYVAVPLDPNAPAAATVSLLRRLRALCVLAPPSTTPVGGRAAAAAAEVGLPFVSVNTAGPPCDLLPGRRAVPRYHRRKCNTLEDTVLLLSTSGTTGDPKAVRFSLARLLSSGRALAQSMGLCTGDTNACHHVIMPSCHHVIISACQHVII
jgi:acyl-CoA synthetase (AMP-forming)/AMP-acid ligase II